MSMYLETKKLVEASSTQTEELEKMITNLELAKKLGFLDSYYADRAISEIKAYLYDAEQEYLQARAEAEQAYHESAQENGFYDNELPF